MWLQYSGYIKPEQAIPLNMEAQAKHYIRCLKPAIIRRWICGLLICQLSGAVIAREEALRGDTVSTRTHPELMPLGVRVGSFLAYPMFDYTGLYNDNVFVTGNNTASSFVSKYSPAISILSDWGNHAVNLSGTADIVRNHNFPSEDIEDWEVLADGRLDLKRNIRFYTGGSIAQKHVPRDSPNDASGLTPIKYGKARVFARYSQEVHRLEFRLFGDLQRRDYYDVPAIRNGRPVIINNDDRDRTEYTTRLRFGYEYTPVVDVFTQLDMDFRNYDENQKFIDASRSSKGYQTLAGVRFDLRDLAVGSIAAGYRVQNYYELSSKISKPVLVANVNWNATELTTFSFSHKPTIREATNLAFSGYVHTETLLNVDHELRRNLILTAGLRYLFDDYEAVSFDDRNDSTYGAFIISTYKINRNFYLSMLYDYSKRDSSSTISSVNSRNSFTRNLIYFRLRAQL